MRGKGNEFLAEFLNSEYYQAYEESWYGDLGINPWDRDVCQRVEEYAVDGGDGRTHAEVLELQKEAIKAAERDEEIDETKAAIMLGVVDECWDWHLENESLDQVIG
jgi:hypothetical protein